MWELSPRDEHVHIPANQMRVFCVQVLSALDVVTPMPFLEFTEVYPQMFRQVVFPRCKFGAFSHTQSTGVASPLPQTWLAKRCLLRTRGACRFVGVPFLA